MSIEFPMEIGHIEEIEEHIVEQDEAQTIVLASEPTRSSRPAANQKIVLLQTPQGVTRAVRVQGSHSSSSTTGTSPGSAVQYVKTESGLVPTHLVHRIVTPAGTPKATNRTFVTTAKTPASVKTPNTSTVTKTITMAQARQMGLINSNAPTSSKVITVGQTSKTDVKILNSAEPAAATKVIRQKVGDPSKYIRMSAGTSATSRVTVSTKNASKSLGQIEYIEVFDAQNDEDSAVPLKGTGQMASKTDESKIRVSNHIAERLVQLEGSVIIPGQNESKIVMLPPSYLDHVDSTEEEVVEEAEIQEVVDETDLIERSISPTPIEIGELAIKKRPCNCTKSQCLKLYCECFANGEFCSNCNCKECFNTIDHEDERQSAIYCCLERNPNAFRPKIAKVSSAPSGLRHHKGCHCKRSGCLKNYCECFEAKIPCSDMCRCVDCKNSDEHSVSLRNSIVGKSVSAIKRAAVEGGDIRLKATEEDDEPPPKQPYNFMTSEVVDATVQCMMAQADECQQNGVSYRNAERLILEEFGRCLGEIIDFSTKNQDN